MKPRLPVELICWIAALILLFLLDTDQTDHLSLCPLSHFGLTWCPGCGLGRSVAALLHGDFITSLKFHWLGLPAVLILFYRIVQLFRNFMLTLSIN